MSSVEMYAPSEVADALLASAGNRGTAAKSLGCSYNTVMQYEDRYPEVKLSLIVAREELTDLAESELRRHVESSRWPAIQFVLQTQGRRRGYGVRVEHTGEDGGPIQHEHLHATLEAKLAMLADGINIEVGLEPVAVEAI